LYYQGRLDAAERLAGVAAAGGGPVTAAVAQVHKVNVLRARGDLPAARRVLEAAPATIRTSRFVEFWLHAEAELALEEGQGEGAHDAACEVAYEAAEACGTLRPLEQALELMPAVHARRVDAEPADERRWRLLVPGGARPVTASPGEGARLRIRTFGEPAIEVD